MNFRVPGTDEMAEIHQLNGLFLRLIQQAAQAGQAALGFPQELLKSFVSLDSAQLRCIATVPRCVFSLCLDVDPGQPSSLPLNAWESARRSFAQAALHGAWTSARYSSAVARALYGLQAGPVRRLRTLGVADLVSQAAHPGIVSCGFDTVPGVWPALVESSSSPLPRNLVLTIIAAGRGMPAPRPPLAAVAQVR
jgi:hypothetical protein